VEKEWAMFLILFAVLGSLALMFPEIIEGGKTFTAGYEGYSKLSEFAKYDSVFYRIVAFVLAMIISFAVSTLAKLFIDKVTGAWGGIYGVRKPQWTLREQLAQAMVLTKHQKMVEQYDQAIRMVNEILDQDPEFPDALFLKAEILWEGFENSDAAIRYLRKTMRLTSETDLINQKAFALLEELMAKRTVS